MSSSTDQDIISDGSETALRGGCHELTFSSEHVVTAKIPSLPIQLTYSLPSGVKISARGYAVGDGHAKARCYVPEAGEWSWEAKNAFGKGIASGRFFADESKLPGKLQVAPADQRQFRYASGDPFLHMGDTAWRLFSPEEKNWKAYIDQAGQAGITKVRAWLSGNGSSVASYFHPQRKQLDLAFWDEVEHRLRYALTRFPHIQFQLNLFGNDREELVRYEEGDPLTHLAIIYCLERLSSLPNVHWSLACEIDPTKDNAVVLQALSRLGKTVFEQAPWHSLITCGQPRFANFLFDREKWCGMTSLSSLGQVTGEIAQTQRPLTGKPIVLEEDRAEYASPPLQPRYYFRRLFWGLLLSGAHPSYQGLDTARETAGHRSGIYGYYDACHAGRLHHGAHDLLHIHGFFRETGISLQGWVSDDSLGGSNPLLVKSMRSQQSDQCIIYVANPDAHEGHSGKDGKGFYSDLNASPSDIFTTFSLDLPFGSGAARWYSPSTGQWRGEVAITKPSTIFLTPEPGDWILWIQKS
ncbi:DUF4038 domain-containing protein [Pelagicoccus sp. SDUM812003]|uniref:apiosidase-like domain-containing protein n=1 Tax=Pelagicoccus sp. SDUM812003 TaxID=3041267 RepID=UPI00280E00E3|nr:DUF4038 domain-containing protein [Pelagicoccus sp. SDUM812003]MDQ8201672.1 DUF4038 domain-containing protein [Pelagicoccus sp. SDUM812003]